MRVAKVTMNRLAHRSFPKTLCKVVYQILERPAFSWTAEKHNLKSLLKIKDEAKAWDDSREIAELSMRGNLTGLEISDNTVMYHANYIEKPRSWKYVNKEFKSPYHTYYNINENTANNVPVSTKPLG
jgi:hypothetical protein